MTETELMLEVARLRFEEDLNMDEIARRLGIAERDAGPILRKGGAWLLDEIHLLKNLEASDTPERRLAARVRDKCGLVDVVIASDEMDNHFSQGAPLKAISRAAARYFDRFSRDAENEREIYRVAVSGCHTTFDMLSSLVNRRRPNIYWYPSALIGRGVAMMKASHISPETNCTAGWYQSGMLPEHLVYRSAPEYTATILDPEPKMRRAKHNQAREALFKEAKMLATSKRTAPVLADMTQKINMAIAEFGVIKPPNAGNLGERMMVGLLEALGLENDYLAEEEIAGDLAYNLFDDDGNGRDGWKFFLTPGDGVEFYKGLVRDGCPVIGIGDHSKIRAIRAAIKGRLLNVLVTDSATGNELLA